MAIATIIQLPSVASRVNPVQMRLKEGMNIKPGMRWVDLEEEVVESIRVQGAVATVAVVGVIIRTAVAAVERRLFLKQGQQECL
jgi:hypothetical protein